MNCSGELPYLVYIDANVNGTARWKTGELPLLLHNEVVSMDDVSPFTKQFLAWPRYLNRRVVSKLVASYLKLTDNLLTS